MFTQGSGVMARPRSFWIGVVVTLVISTLLIAGALVLGRGSQDEDVGSEPVRRTIQL